MGLGFLVGHGRGARAAGARRGRRRDDRHRHPGRGHLGRRSRTASRPARPTSAAAAAFPAALDLIDEVTLERVRTHEISLTAYALETPARPGRADHLRSAGRPTARGGLVSFHDPLVHPHDMAQLLDARGVAVRAGHHCAQPLHRRLGVVATTRASFGMYNSHDDVDALVDAIRYARSVFGRMNGGMDELYREVILDHHRSPRGATRCRGPADAARRRQEPVLRRRGGAGAGLRRRDHRRHARRSGAGAAPSPRPAARSWPSCVPGRTSADARTGRGVPPGHAQRRRRTGRRTGPGRPGSADRRAQVPGARQVRPAALDHPARGAGRARPGSRAAPATTEV